MIKTHIRLYMLLLHVFPKTYLSVWVGILALRSEGSAARRSVVGADAACGRSEDRAVGGSAASSETTVQPVQHPFGPSLFPAACSSLSEDSLCVCSEGSQPSSMWSAVIGRGDLVRPAHWGREEGRCEAFTPRVPIGGHWVEWSAVGLGLHFPLA